MRKSAAMRNHARGESTRSHSGLQSAGFWTSLLVGLLAVSPPAGVAADITLAVEARWRGQAIDVPSAEVRSSAGQWLRITRLAALVSEVRLLQADGGAVRLDHQFGLLDFEGGKREIALRGVPEGKFVGLEFQVGVPANVNHADPAGWPAGHPLHPLVNRLHWGWQGGYVFAALEGHWTGRSAEQPREDLRGFSYHLATDARLMTVRFLANYQVEGSTRIRLAIDLARMFGTERLAADDGSESTHSAEGDERAVRLSSALERSWFWLGCERDGSRERERVDGELKPLAHAHGYETRTPFAFAVPAGFPQPALPDDNPLTVEGVALGERLFFDPRLSRDGTQSCAACHTPMQAFSDTVALSRGVDGTPGIRNAMPLFNLAWQPNYAWDGSQPRIRDQARAAWTNPIEMAADPAKRVAVLTADPALRDEFQGAFGSAEVTAERVVLALEQYLLTIVSADAKFDRAMRGTATLTEEERRGFELFVTEYDPVRGRLGADCFHCHGGGLFSDFLPKNNGLDLSPLDAGRAGITGIVSDHGKFKTPSLRNVAVTAPYMHDGRFATLEQVVAHYDHGVARAGSLDPNLAKHPRDGLRLSAEDQSALVAFLRTLTDERLVGHSSPSQ